MIKTWTTQLNTLNILVSIAGQQENLLKQSSTMNLYGTRVKIVLNQINFRMNLNILAKNAAQPAKKAGLAFSSEVRHLTQIKLAVKGS